MQTGSCLVGSCIFVQSRPLCMSFTFGGSVAAQMSNYLTWCFFLLMKACITFTMIHAVYTNWRRGKQHTPVLKYMQA